MKQGRARTGPSYVKELRRRARWMWAVGVSVLGLLALAPAALAQTPDSWSGGSTTTHNWSDNGNWSGGVAPTLGTTYNLTFPALASCAPGAACYTSVDDIAGAIAVDTLTINDSSQTYSVSGGSVTLSALARKFAHVLVTRPGRRVGRGVPRVG